MGPNEGRPLGRLLGIDYGSVRIGLALSDPMRIIASGAGVLPNNNHAVSGIASLIREQEVAVVVVGMPVRADGSAGTIAVDIEKFISDLSALVTVPIETWDEGFTSVRAKAVFLQGGMKRKARREKSQVDEMAARLLLQDYLDSTRA